jgi:hypothetical protein
MLAVGLHFFEFFIWLLKKAWMNVQTTVTQRQKAKSEQFLNLSEGKADGMSCICCQNVERFDRIDSLLTSMRRIQYLQWIPITQLSVARHSPLVQGRARKERARIWVGLDVCRKVSHLIQHLGFERRFILLSSLVLIDSKAQLIVIDALVETEDDILRRIAPVWKHLPLAAAIRPWEQYLTRPSALLRKAHDRL